ncbi:MFS transporter [Alicyclobacillus vulcanalis]|uniref:Drug resistance transporter, EmrB/QacA subfamily n=1 Tax=Alicyclobacillus vulcanalis TaxID=252246 RepID=A0A1N7M3T9_9BACL|nr:MFS transporter [Alicyclobacillus vulcanalis]SIS80639.1 drug resistance transporter, EmrB/QacA subfamily [Alicyclobacillus vulcanalis]
MSTMTMPFKEPRGGRRALFLVTIALGVLLNPLNSSMISVAMAKFEHVFHVHFTTASWLISSYYLASAVAQPIMGKVADLLGRKPLFLLGLLLVTLSCALAPFAPSFTWLVVFRLIQSFGSGAIYPAGMGIVRNVITDRQAQALAFLSVFSSGAAAFGPSIGGVIMNYLDWKGIFLVNFPFVVASFVLALFVLPNPPKGERQSVREVLREIDLPGIALFIVAIATSLVFLLSLTDRPTWWALACGVAAFATFGWREHTAHSPFLSLRFFKQYMPLTWVLIQFTTVNIIFYSIFFGMPTYLQEVRGFGSQETGLIMLTVAGFSLITAPVTGRWVARSGSRPPLILAAVFMTAGSLLLLTLHTKSPVGWLCVVLSVLGLSNGFNNVGLQTALFRTSPREVISTASGLFQMSRYMGTILSTVVLGFLFGARLTTAELHVLAVVLACLGALVLAMSLRLPRKA